MRLGEHDAHRAGAEDRAARLAVSTPLGLQLPAERIPVESQRGVEGRRLEEQVVEAIRGRGSFLCG
jgi:hypothetical protein